MSNQPARLRKSCKKHYRALLTLLLFFFVFSSSAQDNQLVHKTYAQRVILLNKFYQNDLVDLDSLTLFARINKIKQLAIANQDDDLLMEAAILRAHYFFYRNFPSNIVIPMLDSLAQNGKKQKRLWLEVMAQNMLAIYNFRYRVPQNYEQSFVHRHRVYNLVKKLSPAYFPHKQHCLFQTADEYFFFNEYQKAIFYNLLALKATPPTQLDPVPLEISIMNTLGLCYQKLGMIDSAAYYFKQTINMAKSIRAEQWDGIASGNLGYNLFLTKQYAAATPLLEKDVKIAVQTNDWGLASGSQMVLANISLLNGNVSQAGERIALAREYVNKSGQYQRLLILYPILSKWYAFVHQPERSAMYLDSSMFVKDSLSRKLNAIHVLRATQKMDIELQKVEMEHIKAERTINILQRNILLGVVICIMMITMIVYREQRKKAHRQNEQMEKAREDLKNASRQLDDFAKNISEKNALVELLEEQNGVADKEAIRQLQQSTILTDADWAYFRGLFEKVHNGYLERLRMKLPGLTPAETRFMALSKLGLSTREMAAMLGIGTDAVRHIRSRLRKKLNLAEDETDLTELAAQV
jgi:DNA-binding CsgD family transcriptional regulator